MGGVRKKMAIKKLYCPRCSELVGAEDTKTGEHEYIGGAMYWNDMLYCRNCYNKEIADNTDWLGGVDGIEFA